MSRFFREIGISSEPVRISNYVKYLDLQHYEPGMQYNAHEWLLQLRVNIFLNVNDDCMFKINLVMIMVALNIMMIYVSAGLCI